MFGFWAALRDSRRRRLDAALAAFGLEMVADWPCRWLSAGQRRRLALARLVAAPAPIWLLDEPSAALDADGEARLVTAIAEHRAAGGRVALATHQPIAVPEAARIALDDFAVSPEAALARLVKLLMAAFFGLFRRDLRLALRQGGEVGLVLGFFVLAVLLFPFGVGPEPELLERIAAGIIWVAALLAAVLSLDRLFAADHADGGLDLIALSPMPLELAALAKMRGALGHDRPAVDPDQPAAGAVRQSRPGGHPGAGARPAARDAGAEPAGRHRRGADPWRPPAGVLVSLVVLPLYLPPLIFGSGAVEASLDRRRRLCPPAVARRGDPGGVAAGAAGDRRGVAPGARLRRWRDGTRADAAAVELQCPHG